MPKTRAAHHELVAKTICVSIFIAIFGSYLPGSPVEASTPVENLPLVSKNYFSYKGAFRLNGDQQGISRIGYAEGIMTLGQGGGSIFIIGHAQHQAVAEFSIPELSSNNVEVEDLNFAAVIQPFTRLLDRTASGNSLPLDRIGGMEYVDGKLVVNTYEYYDANNRTILSTLVVDDASKLNTSPVNGFYGYDAVIHASGWISSIPQNLQTALGGSYMAGNSSGTPIISRHSVGPTAFAFNLREDILNAAVTTTIPTVKLMDFSLEHTLGTKATSPNFWVNVGAVEPYLLNEDRTNKLWTHLSRAVYGFVIPGTRSYMTIGHSGGHDSGIGYKVVQDNGIECGGHCSFAIADNNAYYWMWDLNDLLEVKNGQRESHDILPYEYGVFGTQFQTDQIRGGAFDAESGTLYLALNRADTKQSIYESQPIIEAYSLPEAPTTTPSTPSNFRTTISRSSMTP